MPSIPIRSNPDPSTPQPWFEFTIDATSVTFTKANGLSAAKGKTPDEAEKGLKATPHLLVRSLDAVPGPDGVAPKDEVHVLAVTLDGKVEFVPMSQQKPVYYAHLGWQQPDGTWDLLEFIDG